MACVVLHNFLSLRGEEDDWLNEEIGEYKERSNDPVESHSQEAENTSSEMKLAGEIRRTSLREKLQESPLLV